MHKFMVFSNVKLVKLALAIIIILAMELIEVKSFGPHQPSGRHLISSIFVKISVHNSSGFLRSSGFISKALDSMSNIIGNDKSSLIGQL